MSIQFISAEDLTERVNVALSKAGYRSEECRAHQATDDRIILRGKKAAGEVSRPTNSLEPWKGVGIKHMMLVRILEEVLEAK